MKIQYDKEVDALYIRLRPVTPTNNVDIEDGVTVDLDKDGHIVGIEILDASYRLGRESLLNVSIENIPLEKAVSHVREVSRAKERYKTTRSK